MAVTTDRETDYLTPEQMEAVKAASEADGKLSYEIVKRRYERAVDYLDDGKWTIDTKYAWRRSYDGHKLTFLVDKDRYNLTDPFKGADKGYWSDNAFKYLFTVFHETIDGFGENELKKLQRTRIPRKNAESYSPRETLYLNKLRPEFLTVKEKRWNENKVPPKEILEQIVKWDDYLQMLIKVNPDRDTTEFVFDQNFVELNGEMYAIWRVRSMLEFGNQEGYASKERWKELLAKHPKSVTPLMQPPLSPATILVLADDQSHPSFRYKRRIKKRDLVVPPLRAQSQEDELKEPKRREDQIHDARVVAAQAQKAALFRGIRRKKKDE